MTLSALTLAAALLGCGDDSSSTPPPVRTPTPPKPKVVEEPEPEVVERHDILTWSVGTTEWYLPVQDGSFRILGVTHVEQVGDQLIESRVMFEDSLPGGPERPDTSTSGLSTWLPGLAPRIWAPGPKLNRATVRDFTRCEPGVRDQCPAFDYASTADFRSKVVADIAARVGVSEADVAARALLAWSEPFTVQPADAIPRGCGVQGQPACPTESPDTPTNLELGAGGVKAGWVHVGVLPAVEGDPNQRLAVSQVLLNVDKNRLGDAIEAEVPSRAWAFGSWAGERANFCSQDGADCAYVAQVLTLGDTWPVAVADAAEDAAEGEGEDKAEGAEGEEAGDATDGAPTEDAAGDDAAEEGAEGEADAPAETEGSAG